ncbi:hypothetical protein I7I48_07001 [Histoplasma ohiense]|nr:hypothetical protein I7I48_07001 [Histoplasma ohiense (nom. inval.)]
MLEVDFERLLRSKPSSATQYGPMWEQDYTWLILPLANASIFTVCMVCIERYHLLFLASVSGFGINTST